jgi:hypothetical protein
MFKKPQHTGVSKCWAFLLLVTLSVSGCASLAKSILYPYTEHGKCIEKCKKQNERTKDTYVDRTCIDRCDREFGWEESRPSRR